MTGLEKSLLEFEDEYPIVVEVSKQLNMMGITSEMMLYSIGDLKDWQALNQGNFANN